MALVAADFNLDGKMDLCTGNAILLGNGDGTFRSPVSLNTSGPVVAAGDFNSDGKPDLAITNPQTSNNLQILLGNGDGTFQPAIPINPGAALTQLIVRDVNGDGKPDILGMAGNLFVLLGNGDGTFRAPLVFVAGPSPDLMQLGDFNGDGKLDVVMRVAGMIAVLSGNGDGTFNAPINTVIGLDVLGMAVGDVNSDGKLDLVLDDFLSYQTFVLLGNGDGTFQAPGNPVSGTGALALADLNGDGKPELIIQSDYGQGAFAAIIYQGLGNGTFTHLRDHALNFNGSGTRSIVLADFNNDGKIDLAMDSSILLGHGDGTFAAAPAFATPGNNVFSGTTADFNNDGNVDVVANIGLSLDVLVGDGAGFFSLAHSYSWIGSPIVASDVNGDGKLDVVSARLTNNLLVLTTMLGNGDGSLGPPIDSPTGVNSGFEGFAIADFNGDHKPDVAIPGGSGDGFMLIFPGNGDGSFATPLSFFAGASPYRTVAADFNNDGKVDLAVSSSAGIAILLGNGDGTFQPATFLNVDSRSSVSFAADLNGDEKIDLVGSNGTQLQVFLGNGDGTFRTLAPLTSPSFVTVAGVVDVNGDGALDLISIAVPDGMGAQLNVLLGNGDGTFGAPVLVTATRLVPISFLATADFNNDKAPDVLIGLGGLHWEPVGGLFTFLNITPPDFGIAASPTSVTIPSAGQSATSTITITGSAGFAGSVNLTCSVSPNNRANPPTCSLSPSSITISPSQNSGAATVTILTTAPMSGALRQNRRSLELLASAASGIFGCFFLIGPDPRKRRTVLVLLVLAFVVPTVGCGGGSGGTGSSGGTTSGTYTVTVTASSGAAVHSGKVTVTIP